MLKKVRTPGYNYNFNPKTGYFVRWGKRPSDDPQYSPLGPEILDIEISTICHGITGTPCAFCYKANTSKGDNMTLETFKKLFSKFNNNLTQIAFGIGDVYSNPDMFAIFQYARDHGVIPNVTTNGYMVDPLTAKKLADVCGAVAVSRYQPKDVCYNAVKNLTDAGLDQVNIHMLVSRQTFTQCLEVLEDIKTDSRLKKLNAVVFLSLKQKGRGIHFSPVDPVKYKELIDKAFEYGIRIGFDSCSAHKFLKAIKGRPDKEKLEKYVEPCESGLFSGYINWKCEYFPCSFTEGEEGYKPINILEKDSFMDVWNSPEVENWRKLLFGSCRNCPVFRI